MVDMSYSCIDVNPGDDAWITPSDYTISGINIYSDWFNGSISCSGVNPGVALPSGANVFDGLLRHIVGRRS